MSKNGALCSLCGIENPTYKRFPYQVNNQLHRGPLCIKCARGNGDGPLDLTMTEDEAIQELQEDFSRDSLAYDRLEAMKDEDFEKFPLDE